MEVTPELAELFGAYIGEGSISAKKGSNGFQMSIAVGKDTKEWLNYLVNLFEQVFNYRPKLKQYSESCSIRIWDRKICQFFIDAGFPVGKKAPIVRVPKAIMEISDLHNYKAFLRGYFDGEGCLHFSRSYGRYIEFKKTHHHYPRLLLSSASKYLIVGDIAYMLKYTSLRPVFREIVHEGKLDEYNITISGAVQLELWMREIGSSNPVHFSKYEVWKRFGFCPPNTTLEQRRKMLSGELDPKVFYKNM